MSVTRPQHRPNRPKPESEDLFNVIVVFNDDEPNIYITEVLESELVSMYEVLGQPDARARFQTEPGRHYFTAANRIKHITATIINETSN